jgi:gentisate 1,2-dioxygenase
VDGEKVEMHRGDFVITPTWSLHDHGAEGDRPVMWLDGPSPARRMSTKRP